MTKQIASSGSAENLCRKKPRMAAVADRLRHRKVTRSFTLEAVLWRELRYVAHDSGYGTVENFLEQYALESLEMVAELKRERAKEAELKR